VIGCGGSGGATLAYMIDYLTALLSTKGITELPAGWQFVHVDVPVSEESAPDGLAAVGDPTQGRGRYVSLGRADGNYAVLHDEVVGTATRQGKGQELAGWSPRLPKQVQVTVSQGAGQFRVIGRMVTLSRVTHLRDDLQKAIDAINDTANTEEMNAVADAFKPDFGEYSKTDKPIVLVIGSMAGGAGASMLLDLCRILTENRNLDSGLMVTFMLTPDTFDSLPTASRAGIGPNALAMLGEIVAAQSGAARQHDKTLLSALGLTDMKDSQTPFARAIPIGRHFGSTGSQLSDAKQVYRSLGRGLAALMVSGNQALKDFVDYDLGNPPGVALTQKYFGWGVPDNNSSRLLWHSFGFASISTGRDRYGHYAGQRIARAAVDRLRLGHLQPGDTTAESAQLETLANAHFPNMLEQLKLPPNKTYAADWAGSVLFRKDELDPVEEAVLARVAQIPEPAGQNWLDWLPTVKFRMNNCRLAVESAIKDGANTLVWQASQRLAGMVEDQLVKAVANFGLPFAIEIGKRFIHHFESEIADGLSEYRPTVTNPVDVSKIPGLPTNERRHKKEYPTSLQTSALKSQVEQQCRLSLREQAGKLLQPVLRSLCTGAIKPLIDQLAAALQELDRAVAAGVSQTGLADLVTDFYAAWPQDDSIVPDRFKEAQNEKVLTSAAEFLAQFQADLGSAFSPPTTDQTEAWDKVLRSVLTGQWPTPDGQGGPGQPWARQTEWRCEFLRDPENPNEVVTKREAVYQTTLHCAALRERSSQFVNRRGESFDKFISVSLRDFLASAHSQATDQLAQQRQRALVAAFQEALDLAKPMVGVDRDVVNHLHASTGEANYRFKFSTLPFGQSISAELVALLSANRDNDASTVANFTNALDAGSDTRTVTIFGSYAHYAPLAFNTVWAPIAEQWQAAGPAEKRDFWRHRRSRPLAAALPFTDAERRAMVAGWVIGRVVGDISLPPSGVNQPVRIYSELTGETGWQDFPWPMLTPPDSYGFQSVDWLPAVLESVLLAFLWSNRQPVLHSLLPYRALRGKYDSGDQPTSGQLELAGVRRLAQWIHFGLTAPDGVSMLSQGIAAAAQPDAALRADLATSYVQQLDKQVALPYLEGQTKANPQTQEDIARLPLMASLAEDLHWATQEVALLITQAVERDLSDLPRNWSTLVGNDSGRWNDFTGIEL
jgi:hypothetical protein